MDGILGALDNPPSPDEGHRVLNIGNSHPVGLMTMIATLKSALGQKAQKIMRPMHPGDVTATFANISKLNAIAGYRPKVMLSEGIQLFVEWYREFYWT